MSTIERVTKICVSPRTEWSVIAGETTPAAGLITGYVLPLAAIGAAAGFIAGSVIGYSVPFFGTFRVPVATGLGTALFAVAMAVAGVFVLSLVIDMLAPTFGGERNSAQALKVAVYSYTPAWIAGVFQIVPALAVLALVVALYGFYLLYLGLPSLMKCPEEKAVPYTAVVVLCAIVTTVVLTAAGGAIVGTGAPRAGALSGAGSGVAAPPELQEMAQRLEESAERMAAAEAAGGAAAQTAAAMEGLGALLGGSGVEPVAFGDLAPLLPETFAGLPKTGSDGETSGLGGLTMSRAEATYGDGAERDVTLEVTDTGGASGLMGLAAGMGLESHREDADGFERSRRDGSRLIHERMSRSEGVSELSVSLGGRFMVTATGRGVALDDIEAAVASLDLARLESMAGGRQR